MAEKTMITVPRDLFEEMLRLLEAELDERQNSGNDEEHEDLEALTTEAQGYLEGGA